MLSYSPSGKCLILSRTSSGALFLFANSRHFSLSAGKRMPFNDLDTFAMIEAIVFPPFYILSAFFPFAFLDQLFHLLAALVPYLLVEFLTMCLGRFFSALVPDVLVELVAVCFGGFFSSFMSGLFDRHFASILFSPLLRHCLTPGCHFKLYFD